MRRAPQAATSAASGPASLTSSSGPVGEVDREPADYRYSALRLGLDLNGLLAFAFKVHQAIRYCGIVVELRGPRPNVIGGAADDLKVGGTVWQQLKGLPRELLLLEGVGTHQQPERYDFSLCLLAGLCQWWAAAEQELLTARKERRMPIAVLPGASQRIPDHGMLLPFCQADAAIDAFLRGMSQMDAAAIKKRRD